VQRGATDEKGYTEWRLCGSLDRLNGIDFDSWCYLLGPGRQSFTGNFTESFGDRNETTFSVWDREKPSVEGLSLAYLSAAHQAYHVWMVEEGAHGWTEGIFAASDALAEHFVGTDGRNYQKRSKVQEGEAMPSGEQSERWVIPGGWDHEHCAVCWTHIDPGDRYFHHAELNELLCETCFERHVVAGDISFARPAE
jgi:hypothetical protein